MRQKRLDPTFIQKEKAYSRSYRSLRSTKEKRVRNQVRYERKLKFGITDEQYTSMKAQQNNCCAICGTDTPGGRGDWHIDHCHKTNNVRALLCFRCNTGLGHFLDNSELLLKAYDYILKHDKGKT